MPSIYDLYIRDNIMETCETYFNNHLEDYDILNESLTEEDRDLIRKEIDNMLIFIAAQLKKFPPDSFEAYDDIIDKLVGFCVISKMNEVRLGRVINNLREKDK